MKRLLLTVLLVIGPGTDSPTFPAPKCTYCLDRPAEPGSDLCDGCGLRLERP